MGSICSRSVDNNLPDGRAGNTERKSTKNFKKIDASQTEDSMMYELSTSNEDSLISDPHPSNIHDQMDGTDRQIQLQSKNSQSQSQSISSFQSYQSESQSIIESQSIKDNPIKITSSIQNNNISQQKNINTNTNTSNKTNLNSNSNTKTPFQIMITPPPEDKINTDGSSVATTKDEYQKIKDDLRKKQRDSAENLVQWKKVADFAAILPKEAKEKLWKGVFKTTDDQNLPEIKRINKVLRTFVMLHLTRQYKREKKDVPESIRSKLQIITKNPSKFIAEFIKQTSDNHQDMFASIFTELKTTLETDKKLDKKKLNKKLKTLQNNYHQLTGQPLSAAFNQIDFLKQGYLQYLLYSYQRKMDEL